MAVSEIEDRLRYRRMINRLDKLEQAFYNAKLIMNEKANDIYKDVRSEILGIDNVDKLKTDIRRYKMISERLGIKYPGERVE